MAGNEPVEVLEHKQVICKPEENNVIAKLVEENKDKEHPSKEKDGDKKITVGNASKDISDGNIITNNKKDGQKPERSNPSNTNDGKNVMAVSIEGDGNTEEARHQKSVRKALSLVVRKRESLRKKNSLRMRGKILEERRRNSARKAAAGVGGGGGAEPSVVHQVSGNVQDGAHASGNVQAGIASGFIHQLSKHIQIRSSSSKKGSKRTKASKNIKRR